MVDLWLLMEAGREVLKDHEGRAPVDEVLEGLA